MSISVMTDRIQAQAKTIDPLKVLIFLIVMVPFMLGWTARIMWVLISLLLAGARDGWTQADAQIKARRGAVS